MTRTVRLAQRCDPICLNAAMDAAGFKVTTVRGRYANKEADAVVMFAVNVFDESVNRTANAAGIQAVIAAHLNDPAVKGKSPSPATGVDKEESLSRLEIV